MPAPASRPAGQAGDTSVVAHAVAAHDHGSLRGWVAMYWSMRVVGGSTKTAAAKRQDIERFLRFFDAEVGGHAVDDWATSAIKAFVAQLQGQASAKTGTALSPAVQAERRLAAGDPFAGVRAIEVDRPAWKGLSRQQLMRFKVACDRRLVSCAGRDQEPLLEAAVFHTLLQTGLREHELVALDLVDYEAGHHGARLPNVKRKGARVSRKVPVPGEARQALERYVRDARPAGEGALFVSRRGQRLTVRGVSYICERLAQEASATLDEAARCRLAPHQLRHTSLKRVADKHGLHHAQAMGGNLSMRDVFRYATPCDEEMRRNAEGLFT